MALPDAAASNYLRQQRISLSTLALARRLWAKLGVGDFDQAWRSLGPQLVVSLAAGQQAAATQALAYVPVVLDELGVPADAVGDVNVKAFVGVASDGRALASLLYQPVVAARAALGGGADLRGALRSGGSVLDNIVSTQVADAGRAAESVAAVVRPAVTGYVRMLNLPSCDRCAVLAGRFYRWNEGFQRHPRCDCRHIPATEHIAGDMTVNAASAVKAGQVTGLSKRDTQAIADGADVARVINAHRGMSTEMFAGQSVKTTTALAGRGQIRLRPESIYKLADDRQHALDLLAKYGYIVK